MPGVEAGNRPWVPPDLTKMQQKVFASFTLQLTHKIRLGSILRSVLAVKLELEAIVVIPSSSAGMWSLQLKAAWRMPCSLL